MLSALQVAAKSQVVAKAQPAGGGSAALAGAYGHALAKQAAALESSGTTGACEREAPTPIVPRLRAKLFKPPQTLLTFFGGGKSCSKPAAAQAAKPSPGTGKPPSGAGKKEAGAEIQPSANGATKKPAGAKGGKAVAATGAAAGAGAKRPAAASAGAGRVREAAHEGGGVRGGSCARLAEVCDGAGEPGGRGGLERQHGRAAA